MIIYRGYEIKYTASGNWGVYMNGECMWFASTEDAAMSWVDAERRKQLRAKGAANA